MLQLCHRDISVNILLSLHTVRDNMKEIVLSIFIIKTLISSKSVIYDIFPYSLTTYCREINVIQNVIMVKDVRRHITMGMMYTGQNKLGIKLLRMHFRANR